MPTAPISVSPDSPEPVSMPARPVDPDELGKLLNQHFAALTLYARQWSAASEDIVQEAFIQLARQPQAPDHTAAWLYRVVRNRAIAIARSETRRRRHEQAAGQSTAPWFVPDPANKIDGDRAARALGALPLDEREVIVAHLWGGLTFAELAEVTGLSSSTAHRRYETGLRRLREQLGE